MSVSKCELLKELGSAAKVVKFAKPNNGLYREDKRDIIKNVTSQLVGQGCPEDEIKVEDDKITWPGGFFFFPKYPAKGEEVKVTVRSKDLYTVGESGAPVFSDIKDYQVADDGLSLIATYSWGSLTLSVAA